MAAKVRGTLERVRVQERIAAIERGPFTRFVRYRSGVALRPGTHPPPATRANVACALQGLTKRMHDRFFPRHRFRSGRAKRRRLGLRGGSSAREGTRIHAHIRHAINCLYAGNGSCRCPRPPRGDMPELVRLFLVDLRKHGMKPVIAECPAWSVRKRVMTLVDVLARRADGRLVIIEVKTGAEGEIDRVDPSDNMYFSAPFTRGNRYARNTVRQRHYLQAVLSLRLFNEAYAGELGSEEAWVVYLNRVKKDDSNGPETLLLTWYAAHIIPWAANAGQCDAVYDAL